MKSLEAKYGFDEAKTNDLTGKKVDFFNLGPDNDWRKLLDKKLINKIELQFQKEMIELNYI